MNFQQPTICPAHQHEPNPAFETTRCNSAPDTDTKGRLKCTVMERSNIRLYLEAISLILRHFSYSSCNP